MKLSGKTQLLTRKTLLKHEFQVNMTCNNLLTLPHSFHMDRIIILFCPGEMLDVMHNILTKCDQACSLEAYLAKYTILCPLADT